MRIKKATKLIALLLMLILQVSFINPSHYVKAATTDPLIGKWERYEGGNKGMEILVTKVGEEYKAVVQKIPTSSWFKVGDLKWKSVKLNSNASYSGKDLYMYNDRKKSIYVDINITVTKGGELKISTTYPQGVKAVKGQYQKWRKLKNTFDVTINAWPVQNTKSSFGYGLLSSYKIPHEQFEKVFGKIDEETLKKIDKKENVWKGYCFGMAITAILYQQGKITLPDVEVLSNKGFDKIQIAATDIFKKEPALERHSELFNVIQQYQIYGDLADYIKNYVSLEETMEKWNGVEPLLVEVGWFDENYKQKGHALVTDTSRKIVTHNGYKRIYLYDPNFPYYTNSEKYNLASHYKEATKRYIDINLDKRDPDYGNWKIIVGSTSDSQKYIVTKDQVICGKKTYKRYTGLMIYSLDDLDIPTSFNGTAKISQHKLD